MTQSQFGRLVGLSRATVQAVELGTLALSERAANLISEETSVDVRWLLENRREEPPVTRKGEPWNLEWFKLARRRTWRGTYLASLEPRMDLFRTYYQLRCMIGDRQFRELTNFWIAKEKALADLWNTIGDRDERNRIFRAYFKERMSSKERFSNEDLLKRVIEDARKLLRAMRDLEKRTKRSPEPARPPRASWRPKVKQPVSAKDAPIQSSVAL